MKKRLRKKITRTYFFLIIQNCKCGRIPLKDRVPPLWEQQTVVRPRRTDPLRRSLLPRKMSRRARDEFDTEDELFSEERSQRAKRPGLVKSLIVYIEEYYSLHKAVVVSWLFLLSVMVLAIAGLTAWSLVLVHGTKTVGEAAVTSIQSQLTAVIAQINEVSNQEVVIPPLTASQVLNVMCSSDNGTIGFTNVSAEVGFVQDDCDSIYIVASVFKTSNSLKTAHVLELCAHVGPTLEGLDQYRMAVYVDDGFGYPSEKLVVSEIGTITPNSFNCIPVSGLVLGESLKYWLAFMSNANDCGVLNTLRYRSYPGLRSGFTDAYVWPDFPEFIGGDSFSYFSAVYGMYLSYNATCISHLM
jgi:hypothetical protein